MKDSSDPASGSRQAGDSPTWSLLQEGCNYLVEHLLIVSGDCANKNQYAADTTHVIYFLYILSLIEKVAFLFYS